jgi:hypothetical protein
MANLIQASVYQIDGAPLPQAITLDFQTSNLVIREASIVGTSAVNSAILYYNLPNNQLSVQTFYVGESIAELVAAANVGSTTQLQATVLEINKDPQVPGGVQYSFPANEIVIGENIDYALPDVKSYIQFKGIRYSLFELQADLLASGNGASAYKVYTALLTQSGFDVIFNFSSGPVTKGRTYMIILTSSGADFSNVGGPKYDGVTPINGTYFVAINNDIPNNYGGGQLEYNQAAPVVTVLENTIGNVYWTYDSAGVYEANLTAAFPIDKTTLPSYTAYSTSLGDYFILSCVTQDMPDRVLINSVRFFDQSFQDDVLINTPIEIRVYN